MFGRKGEEGQERLPVGRQARGRFRILRLVLRDEGVEVFLGLLARLRRQDVVQRALGRGLETFRELVQDISQLVEPVALLGRPGPHVPDGAPEPQGPIANRDHGRLEPAALQPSQQLRPALGTFAVPVLERDELLRPVGARADDHQRAQAVVLQPDVEVNPVDPDIDVVPISQVALPELPILVFPDRGQPRDVGRAPLDTQRADPSQ